MDYSGAATPTNCRRMRTLQPNVALRLHSATLGPQVKRGRWGKHCRGGNSGGRSSRCVPKPSLCRPLSPSSCFETNRSPCLIPMSSSRRHPHSPSVDSGKLRWSAGWTRRRTMRASWPPGAHKHSPPSSPERAGRRCFSMWHMVQASPCLQLLLVHCCFTSRNT